jgi:hypothetical protein
VLISGAFLPDNKVEVEGLKEGVHQGSLNEYLRYRRSKVKNEGDIESG